MTFSTSQQVAYDAAQSGKNIFITGSGGNGKSFLTKALTTPRTVVVAPTGIAALNVNGSTCHRTFGLPFGLPVAKDFQTVSAKVAKLFGGDFVQRIIISEVGMVRTDMLSLIDKKLRLMRGSSLPFGGIQVIVEGDFYQLEPIVSRQEEEHFYDKHEHPFAFGSKSWEFTTYELTDPQRHPNIDHYNILNKIRVGDKSGLKELLDVSKPYELSSEISHLCCYNRDAANVNSHWYKANSNKEYHFKAYIEGSITEKDVPVPEDLLIKIGCKVMLCANDTAGLYVNGDMGLVAMVTPATIMVMLTKNDTDIIVEVERFAWNTFGYSRVGGNLAKDIAGTFVQFPIALGWAISVHKSQSLTLDSVAIHTGSGTFSHGQFYTACSRVRDLTNLSFIRKGNISYKDLIVKQEVKDFYNGKSGSK